MNRFTFIIHFLFFILFLKIPVFAQYTIEVKGIVLRDDSLSPLNGAAVINKSSFLGTLTNRNGNFKMRVKEGDTLQISHLGYVTYYLIIENVVPDFKDKIRVAMKVRSYELPGIEITRFRIREKPKKPFSLRRTDNITYNFGKINLANPIGFYVPSNQIPGVPQIFPSVGLGIPDMKEAKRRAQLNTIAMLEEKDNLRKYINYKYSKRLVNNLTGLKGNELENFMNFCRPDDKMVLFANDYDMAFYVLDCYSKFIAEYD